MLIDSRQLSSSTLDADLCIIGTGPAGLTIARALGPRRDVVLLEAGPDGDSETSRAAYRGANVGLPYFDLDTCRSRRFGGSGNCWGGFCRIFDAHDFEPRTRIPYSGWPITHTEMLPYYQRAHEVCGLGPLDYTHAFWAEASGQPPSPFARGEYVAPEIRQRAAYDLLRARRELAEAANVRVCLDAAVTEIVSAADGCGITGVTFRTPAGATRTVRARTYVLAAGGIENARLLLASNRVQPHGVGNDRDLVGRFFMDHLDITAGTFEPTDPARFDGQLLWRPAGRIQIRNSLAIAADVRRREQLLRCFFHVGPQTVDHLLGYKSFAHLFDRLTHGRRVHNLRYHLRNLWWDRRALLAALPWRLHLTRRVPNATGRAHLWRLLLTAEPSPNPASRVLLSTARDRHGVPRVALDWRVAPDDFAHVQRSIALFSKDAERLGLGRVHLWAPERWPLRGAYHHMGTTRMSDDPARGVVDRHSRVHGIDNLYVAGSSVFPTAGSGTPTLMIVALALRLADHLRAQAERSRPATIAATA